MDFITDKLSFLGLSEREIRVFSALSTFGRMKMTKIASRAGLPRTTVDAIVRRLIEQGLVKQERILKHFEYSVELNDVANTLDWLESRLRTDNTKNSESEKINDENIVINAEVTDAMAIKRAFKERAGDRSRILLARQPGDIRSALARFEEYIREAVVTGTKTEVLVCSFVADSIKEQGVENLTWDDPNLIRLNIVPSSYCRADSDVIVFPDRVLVRDILGTEVREIVDAKTVESMKHLLYIACETGWSINLSSWLGAYRHPSPETI